MQLKHSSAGVRSMRCWGSCYVILMDQTVVSAGQLPDYGSDSLHLNLLLVEEEFT